jgi:TonB family protein
MNSFTTRLSNNPLKATLLFSILLHAVSFYILSGVSFNLSSRSPNITPIKVTALIQEKGIQSASIKHVTQRYSIQSKHLPKLAFTEIKKLDYAEITPTHSSNSPKYMQSHLKIRNPKTINQIRLTSSNKYSPSRINSKEYYRQPISTISPQLSKKDYYSQKNINFSSTPTKDKVITHKENLPSAVKLSSSSIFPAHDLHNSRPSSIYKTNTNKKVTLSTSVRNVSHTNGFSEEYIKSSQTTSTEKIVSTFKNSSSLNMGELRRGFHKKIWKKVAKAKYYPRMARKRGFEGEPIVTFTLGSKGELINLKLIEVSSYKILNEAALETIRRGTPYPSIPEPLGKKSISFNLPISYVLEE